MPAEDDNPEFSDDYAYGAVYGDVFDSGDEYPDVYDEVFAFEDYVPVVEIVDVLGHCHTNHCLPSCEAVFDMVHVSYLIRGGTRVMWLLSPEFSDPRPWSFQLQQGQTGNANASDWEDVGLEVTNGVFATDPTQHDFAKTISTHYRIILTTPSAIYTSQPTNKLGVLAARDWRLAREIVRKERVLQRYSAQDGFLLKRIVTGLDCSICLDLQTKEVTDPNCPECRGTGKQCGYFEPMSCIWASLSPEQSIVKLDEQGMRGTIQDMTSTARMLMLPIISEFDVWVSARTDERYVIRGVSNIAEIRGVPIVANVALRKLPFTDIVYTVPIPEQDSMMV